MRGSQRQNCFSGPSCQPLLWERLSCCCGSWSCRNNFRITSKTPSREADLKCLGCASVKMRSAAKQGGASITEIDATYPKCLQSPLSIRKEKYGGVRGAYGISFIARAPFGAFSSYPGSVLGRPHANVA